MPKKIVPMTIQEVLWPCYLLLLLSTPHPTVHFPTKENSRLSKGDYWGAKWTVGEAERIVDKEMWTVGRAIWTVRDEKWTVGGEK